MSVGQLCPALCDTTDCSTSGFLSITNHWSLLTLMSIQSVMPSKHLVLCRSFSSSLQSFPTSRSFQMRQFLRPTWLCTLGCPALGEWSHHRGYLGHSDILYIVLLCILWSPKEQKKKKERERETRKLEATCLQCSCKPMDEWMDGWTQAAVRSLPLLWNNELMKTNLCLLHHMPIG